jgi:quercetin dioxygenase-like cupin family protein
MVDRFALLHPHWLRSLAERLSRPASGDRQEQVCLPEGGLWSRRLRGAPRTLVCEKGQVWLTLEGDPRDHVLDAGDSLKVPAGHVVVQALGDACFHLSGCPRTSSSEPWVDSPRQLDYLRR